MLNGLWNFIRGRQLQSAAPVRVQPVGSAKWIRNVKEGHIHTNGFGADCGGAAGAICVTCGKKMPHIWDTVCAVCGATSCYHHSWVDKQRQHWYCARCASADFINADSREYALLPNEKGQR